ncbi:MAG: hypothetical protein K5841_07845 [Fretibacterium sp.]|nr:hypothetical protein [Fretibacterium sp.]
MKKLLNNKLLMMPMIIVLTVSAAMFVFAPGAIYPVNKKYEIKAVKYCLTALVAVPLRKLLDSIVILGVPVGKAIPLFCACGKDENTFDSNLVWFATKQPQVDTEKQLKQAVEHMKTIVKQQKAMVKKGNPDALDAFMVAYKELRKTLQAANVMAWSSNFDADFQKRFPEYTGFNSMSNVEKEVAEGWKKFMDGMMKAMNVTARNFDEEQRARESMMNTILKAYTDAVDHGQTYVLQSLGAVAAEGDALIDRTGAEMIMTLEACLCGQEIERSQQEAVRNNIAVIAGNAAKSQPTTTGTYNFGF